jgi:DNA-binding NtrC family response regulator
VRVVVRSGDSRGAEASATEAPLTVGTAESNDLVLSDPTVSRFHLTIRRQGDRIRLTDQGSTNGTHIGGVEVRSGSVDVVAGTIVNIGATELVVDDGEVVVVEGGPQAFGALLGPSPAMQLVFSSAAKVAATEVPVLILGESGTGKELLARAIHDHSPRADEPFVIVDCAAIPPNLFESVLFGHERGAFTGANERRIGAVERANGGTLFLDEIGELPPDLQTSLLGVLERRQFQRVGGDKSIPADFRIVCATNRNLHQEVNAGRFRLDLFYRIATVRLEIPALRDRPEDLIPLIELFLSQAGGPEQATKVFSRQELRDLKSHAWPGNVRELRNVVLGALALGRAPELLSTPPTVDGDPIEAVLEMKYRNAKATLLEQFERRYLEALLERAGGNIRQAAREGEMNRSYLMELLKRHGMR